MRSFAFAVILFVALVDAQFDELLDENEDTEIDDIGDTLIDPSITTELCANETISEENVIDEIISPRNPAGRPTVYSMEQTLIYIVPVLFGIVDFDEKNNQLKVFAEVTMIWGSDIYSWEYEFPMHCVTQVIVPADKLWIPSFEVWNTPDGEQEFFKLENKRVAVSYSGFVTIKYKGSLVTNCQIDLTYYPFDDQLCMITLISDYYSNETMSVSLPNSTASFLKSSTIWIDHAMWKLVASMGYVRKVWTEEELEAQMVRLKIHLRRDSTYHILNIIVPSLMIGAVTLIVFTMPVAEVARIEIAFTCLLAYTFFQTLVLQEMPRSSLSIPIITIFIQLQMAYIAAFAILPDMLIYVLIEKFVSAQASMINLKFWQASDGNIRKQWEYIVVILQRIRLILYLTAFILTPIVLFYVMPKPKSFDNYKFDAYDRNDPSVQRK